MNQEDESLNIRDILFILRKHLMLLISISIFCGLVGYCVSKWAIKPQYESDATLIVNTSQSSQTANITYDQVTATQQLVNTYSIILKSDTVLDQVIKNLNLNTDSNELASNITVSGVNGTEVIDVTVKNPDPQAAADIANEILQVSPKIIINTVGAGSVAIVSPAKKQDRPVSPNKALNTAISLLVGLIVSAVISLAIEIMNNTFSSGDDMQKYLDYPVLGVIPNMK